MIKMSLCNFSEITKLDYQAPGASTFSYSMWSCSMHCGLLSQARELPRLLVMP